ncbi:hypothetical protein PPYR_00894 [Photinus pyralis]|uniref:GST C-terminal domain-containing protein n=1 Tax=Photinus pyralis TaxID=7054 RepID=A0A1Y1JWX0_PHOPY|nr:eukaryotic translation elongation factor 1 epsilon-1 [Photinus pyralis]KAB0803924.1 hypothetical protein PPYR_00894 [Photinus pyralis]
MTINVIKCLSQIASYLKVNPGKITLESSTAPTRSFNSTVITGFTSIIFQFLKESNCDITGLTGAEIRQWLEYCAVYILNADSAQSVEQILKELNDLLSSKTYLVAFQPSIADVTLFYCLHNIMANLSYLDKEKYLNVSRWFDNMQQDVSVRQKNKAVDFSTNYLTCVAPARH